MTAIVTKPNGKKVIAKNLGYLLRHWQTVRSFTVSETDTPYNDCQLQAKFSDGRRYETDFASMEVLWDWLHRPLFFGLTVDWFGRMYEIKRHTIENPFERRTY